VSSAFCDKINRSVGLCRSQLWVSRTTRQCWVTCWLSPWHTLVGTPNVPVTRRCRCRLSLFLSCRTRFRVDGNLGTLPVNVRTSRAASLSMIRQCRKAKSKGSSFFSEKSTLEVGLSLVCVILLPLSLLSPNKKPSDPVASRGLRATRRAVTRASRAFLPIGLIQRADNDGPTCFPFVVLPQS
jgi:hypothetical protein